MAMWHQYNFQDAASSIMENMIMFYDYAMLVIVMIIMLIMYMLIFMVKNKLINRYLLEGQMIEIIWTIIPMFFLIFLAIPSLKVLYLTDEINNPMFSFKVIGHQWYWEYEYNMKLMDVEFKNFNIDCDNVESMMNKTYEIDSFRLLDVSENFYIPMKCQIRLMVLSDDVIHSFAVPALGIKVDAVPGRLNQISLLINRPGLYYGQCSEICGVNHSFMPIVIESISFSNFFSWMLR
uniref:cytochrome c oxidase subunit 2 n=1 Tax=Eurytoma acutibialis TaxID=3102739 RepID=UPI002E7A3D3D|nr:cytochrome c oxidase subunit 2 [Eurytoma acutibialis]WPS67066.1 cytochrome c oxidase subunit 2 [Eurytoma acutibialis]